MLGIRIIGEIQADLFVGDFRKFHCDGWFLAHEGLAHGFKYASALGHKHLGIVIPSEFLKSSSDGDHKDIHLFMEDLKSHLGTKPPLRRVTLILEDLKDYKRYQEAFWQVFPEDSYAHGSV